MSLQRSHRAARSTDSPMTRVILGAAGGLLSGAAFIALVSWFDTTVGKSDMAPFKAIATIAQGPPPTSSTVWIGMAIHAALSVIFGVIFAVFTQPLRNNRLIALAGLLYGGAVYAVDFQVLARYVHQFSALLAAPNQPMVFTVHLVFGALLSLFVMRSTRTATTAYPSGLQPESARPRVEH